MLGEITGGVFEGERLRGKILSGGSDWQTVRRDGSWVLDVRFVMETDDNHLIGMTYKGIRHGPQAVLDREDFVEQHKLESEHIRYFVGQDDYAFKMVQAGLESRFAPHGPLSNREFVINGMSRWLVDRYRAADAATRAEAA